MATGISLRVRKNNNKTFAIEEEEKRMLAVTLKQWNGEKTNKKNRATLSQFALMTIY